jgi:ATP-binding cassette subfamily F protein uup
LILDEPTNDLDIETLELLESQLVEFNGTVILISHDRRFLDNVVTSLLVFDEPGKLVEIEGGYSDYLRYRAQKVPDIEEKAAVKSKSADTTTAPAVKSRLGSTKLSYKYQRELELLPQELEQLEEDISALEAQTQAVDFAQKSPDEMQQIFQRLADLQQQLEQKLDRWEELESMKSGG